MVSVQNNMQGKGIVTSYQTELERQKKEHKFLQERLSYVQSTQFVEEEARNKLGLVKPGEVLVIAPPEAKRTLGITSYRTEVTWKQWVNLFF